MGSEARAAAPRTLPGESAPRAPVSAPGLVHGLGQISRFLWAAGSTVRRKLL